MNKVLEVLLVVVSLAGLYSAIETNTAKSANASVRAEQAVVVADGSDPMPLCRKRHCDQ